VAISFTAILQQEGYEVVGPVGSIDQALEIIGRQPNLDGVVLDLNLRGRATEPVGFAFVSGSAHEAVPDRFRYAPLVQKPCSAVALLKALTDARSQLVRASPVKGPLPDATYHRLGLTPGRVLASVVNVTSSRW
jgi:hypothetical protein